MKTMTRGRPTKAGLGNGSELSEANQDDGPMSVQVEEIRRAVRAIDAAGRHLSVHASLRSFGQVHGGARTVVDGLLAERCTVLVPSFSGEYAVVPLPHQRPARNG